jgi:hypothetical protein
VIIHIEVEVEHRQGKFVSKDALADEIVSLMSLMGLTVEGSEYEVVSGKAADGEVVSGKAADGEGLGLWTKVYDLTEDATRMGFSGFLHWGMTILTLFMIIGLTLVTFMDVLAVVSHAIESRNPLPFSGLVGAPSPAQLVVAHVWLLILGAWALTRQAKILLMSDQLREWVGIAHAEAQRP